MGRSCSTRLVLPGMVIALVFASLVEGQQDDKRREQIGEVLGKPVYRDEIRTGEHVQLRDELHRLFTAAIMQKYRQTHADEITPSQAEIAAATAYFDRKHRERIKGQESELQKQLKAVEEKLATTGLPKDEERQLEIERLTLQSQLKPPGRQFALFVLRSWKFQRHLYDEYGGGRILWQQAGLEAFDAMHKWLKTQENSGKFKITDPKLQSVFYEYWTTQNHGAFLTDDEEQIRREFLEPEWREKASVEN